MAHQQAAQRLRSFDDLRWPSLTAIEMEVVADLLLRAENVPAYLHLDVVAQQLREEQKLRPIIPVVLTPRQNRAVSETLQAWADRVEEQSERYAELPALERSGHHAAGYIRTVLDRLIKGGTSANGVGLEHIAELLTLESHDAIMPEALAKLMLRSAEKRLQPFKLDESFRTVLEKEAPKTAEQVLKEPKRRVRVVTQSEATDLGLEEDSAEIQGLAKAAFDAALDALWESGAQWSAFLSQLTAGRVPGCELAATHPAAAASAANVAFALTTQIRAHLTESADMPWEAISPGLKAIVDRYPVLKKRGSLKDFVKSEVRKFRRGQKAAK